MANDTPPTDVSPSDESAKEQQRILANADTTDGRAQNLYQQIAQQNNQRQILASRDLATRSPYATSGQNQTALLPNVDAGVPGGGGGGQGFGDAPGLDPMGALAARLGQLRHLQAVYSGKGTHQVGQQSNSAYSDQIGEEAQPLQDLLDRYKKKQDAESQMQSLEYQHAQQPGNGSGNGWIDPYAGARNDAIQAAHEFLTTHAPHLIK